MLNSVCLPFVFFMLPSSFLLVSKILQASSRKRVQKLASVTLLIETKVSPSFGVYNTPFRSIVMVSFPFGMLICMSPCPIARKELLSAAVIDFGVMEV
jgi:hypothetical protein